MAGYSQIKKGAKGSSVSNLQSILNKKGYSLQVDGIFGSKTQAAVRDYQKKNSLSVDGIVGNKTWASLMGTGAAANKTATPGAAAGANKAASTGAAAGGKDKPLTAAQWLLKNEAAKPAYTQPKEVTQAANMLAQYEKNRPGDYQSSYQTQIQGVLDKILNQKEFSYDFASDPLYQQYADRYQQQGKIAMQDAMGQAAALTGGYGNSYAQQVGQQTYQNYLQGVNDVIPELRNAAYQTWQDERNREAANLNMLQGLDSTDYARHRDKVSDYYNDLNYYYGKYSDRDESAYNRHLNDLSAWQADRNYYYGKTQDELSQQNWQKEFDQTQQNWQKEFDFAAQQAKAGGSSSGGSSSKTSKKSSGSKAKSSGSSSKSVEAIKTDKAQLFLDNIVTPQVYNAGKKTRYKAYSNYNAYLDGVGEKWGLTDAEKAWIQYQLGLR